MVRAFRKETWVLGVGLLLVSCLLISCGGQQSQPEEPVAPPPPLSKHYQKVMCYAFSSAPDVAEAYPTAAVDVQNSMTSALGTKNLFKFVGVAKGGKADAQALFVKASVTHVRIVSGAARFWGGAMAGSSFVNLDLELIDGATGKTVRKEPLSTANNPFGAAWSGGSTDNSLLDDMGRIVADYIAAINPAK